MGRTLASPAAAPRSYMSPAIGKAVDILECLSASPDGKSAKALAAELGRSISEIYRALVTLETRGLIRKDSGGDAYTLTMRLFELAHRHPPTERLMRAAQPIMDELANATMQSCHLGVAEGDNMYVIVTGRSPMPMHYEVKIGSVFPLLETSSGIVIASDWSATALSALFSDRDADPEGDIDARLDSVRSRGYEVYESRVVPGITNLSAPVRDSTGRVGAAMTIPYLAQRGATVSRTAALTRLLEAASLLGKRIGHATHERNLT